jgi:hypothetical protein
MRIYFFHYLPLPTSVAEAPVWFQVIWEFGRAILAYLGLAMAIFGMIELVARLSGSISIQQFIAFRAWNLLTVFLCAVVAGAFVIRQVMIAR